VSGGICVFFPGGGLFLGLGVKVRSGRVDTGVRKIGGV